MSRTELYSLIGQAPADVQEKIRETYTRVMDSSAARPQEFIQGSSIPTSDFESGSRTTNDLLEGPFMRAPPQQVIDSAIGEFIDRTSNSALAMGVCAVCARETNRSELTPYRLNDLPSHMLLQPAVAHPAHDIFNGMLLHPAGVFNSDIANVCRECARALTSGKLPSFALANHIM